MNYTKTKREQYNKDREITCKRLDITENQYNWLRRKGEELHKIYEDNCNGVFQTDDDYFRSTLSKEKEVKAYLKTINKNLHAYFQTDPRGATIYVDIKPIPCNNYNQAQCIY